MTHDTESERGLLPCPFCGASASGHSIEPHTHTLVLAGVKMPDYPGSYVIEGDCQCGSGLIGDTQEEVTARWNRRSSRPSPVAQDGDWVMVPREPTVEMILAAVDANQRIPRRKGSPPTVMEIMTTEYKAYLAAAPLSAPKADEEKP